MTVQDSDVKDKGTSPDQDPSLDKDGKKIEDQRVPYDRFKEVNDERNAFKQKAEALDTLWQDPEFQAFIEAKEKGEVKGKGIEDDEEDLDKPLTLKEAKRLFDNAIKGAIKEGLQPFVKDSENEKLQAAVREVTAMEKDDEKFSYFKPWGTSKETDAIRQEMIRLMEQEGVPNMEKAYKIVTYDLALEASRKKTEEDLTNMRKFGSVRSRSTIALQSGSPKVYKSVREAAEDSADKVGF